jgi:transcriptional regulator with XRE-family HTH domain
MTFGERIRAARVAKGWSQLQAELEALGLETQRA